MLADSVTLKLHQFPQKCSVSACGFKSKLHSGVYTIVTVTVSTVVNIWSDWQTAETSQSLVWQQRREEENSCVYSARKRSLWLEEGWRRNLLMALFLAAVQKSCPVLKEARCELWVTRGGAGNAGQRAYFCLACNVPWGWGCLWRG